MINVHLNGDIVRCPDMKEIQIRLAADRLKHRICIYNIHEDQCPVWQNSLQIWQNVKKNNDCGKCMLSGSDLCPGHRDRIDKGNREKTFKIDNTVYRKMASTAHYLVKESVNKVLFITLTFPKFKKKVSNHEINNYFSKYVENLRTNYNCGGYIAVREFGKKNTRVHFHLLLSIPFVPFPVLNAAWCSCIKDICYTSKNAVTSDPKTRFIHNPARAMRYVCKYFAKTKGQVNDSRLVFISNNIIQRHKQIKGENCNDLLKGYKGIYINQTSDYSTLFRITDPASFDKFCTGFLYPLFELSIKKSDYLYSFPRAGP